MTRRLLPLVAGCLLLGAGCGGETPLPPAAAEAPSYPEIALPEAADEDPAPGITHVRLTARPAEVEVAPGRTLTMWSYGGRVPGPLIRVRRGDLLVVELDNQLPEPTTIHWHGVRVPNAMDGAHLVQQPVPPGGRFRYEFRLPDAGLYWFHPHHRSSAQLASGLYAPLLVEDPDEPAGLGRSAVLVFSDVDPQTPVSDGTSSPPGEVRRGREGQLVLVNGRDRPTVEVPAGSRQRWRLVNAARSRFMRIAVPGQQLQLIGSDGGLLERPFAPHDELLLTPGERADVLIIPSGSQGQRLSVKLLPHDRGEGIVSAEQDLFHLQLGPAMAGGSPPLPAGALRSIERLTVNAATTRQVIRIGERPGGFVVNDQTEHAHLRARVGETQVLAVSNHTAFDHPFHLHGFFFQVLEPGGRVREPVEWRDTINLAALTSAQLAVRFDDRPGQWMFHCHILDHAELGLHGIIDVTDADR